MVALRPLPLCAGGNPRTSGPGSSVVSTVLPLLKGLLGTERFGVPGSWWDKDGEGAPVEGHLHFVTSP